MVFDRRHVPCFLRIVLVVVQLHGLDRPPSADPLRVPVAIRPHGIAHRAPPGVLTEGGPFPRSPRIIDQGIDTLLALKKLRQTFLEMSDAELVNYKLEKMSFWNYINMPLSDALHHVGQVSILRRAAGNPIVKER